VDKVGDNTSALFVFKKEEYGEIGGIIVKVNPTSKNREMGE